MIRATPDRIRLTLLLLLLLLAVSPALAGLQAKVISIHDGDTLTVLVDNREMKIRLSDIDAPELKQPFGTRSKQSLSELCYGKVATLDVLGQDRYRRSIASVTCDGHNANAEQVRRGYAWTYTRYAPAGSPLYAIQTAAQSAQRGLWADPSPVAPWHWRRGSN